MVKIIAGGISGAITDTNSDRAIKHATMYYEEIRNNHSDIKKIAQNTGFSEHEILLVKNFLFIDMHDLGDTYGRFEPSFEIAESWQRLAFDKEHIQPHDITLIKHELMEYKLMLDGMSQAEAHKAASKKYNYPYESQEYYKDLGFKNKLNNNSITGAISNNNDIEEWELKC